MSRIVVLFNLKDGVSADDYEAWARSTDIPTVNGLASVDAFSVHRSAGLLIGDGTPPYAYVELIDVNDMQTFGSEVGSETIDGLREGDATVRVVAQRAPTFLRRPLPVVEELALTVKLRPPALQVLSTRTYVAQGGAEAVVYKVGPTSVGDGVHDSVSPPGAQPMSKASKAVVRSIPFLAEPPCR